MLFLRVSPYHWEPFWGRMGMGFERVLLGSIGSTTCGVCKVCVGRLQPLASRLCVNILLHPTRSVHDAPYNRKAPGFLKVGGPCGNNEINGILPGRLRRVTLLGKFWVILRHSHLATVPQPSWPPPDCEGSFLVSCRRAELPEKQQACDLPCFGILPQTLDPKQHAPVAPDPRRPVP